MRKSCKTCRSYFTGVVSDGKHNKWCCKYGKPADKAAGHCKLNNGFEVYHIRRNVGE